jgi:hypothetical protein
MSTLVRPVVTAIALSVTAYVFAVSSTTPAAAFFGGETCKRPVTAVGAKVRGEGNARNSAIAAWQRETARKYGRRFADYYYSGDRTFTCTWDSRGVYYKCGVTALPCG